MVVYCCQNVFEVFVVVISFRREDFTSVGLGFHLVTDMIYLILQWVEIDTLIIVIRS